ncbi:MAG: hypothetical protein PHT33_14260, partial [bacterium]|nr:hypothetical protein [bacterium]
MSFDKVRRTPLQLQILPDKGFNGCRVDITDSAKLSRGISGFGVLMDNPADCLVIDGSKLVSGRQGSVSFWFRPLWSGEDDARKKTIATVVFETGRVQLRGNTLTLASLGADGVWDRKTASAADDMKSWLPGSWHHIVMSWNGVEGKRYLFVDGKGGNEAP